MLTTLNITKVYVDKIAKIEVEEGQELLKDEESICKIAIWTTDGHKYEFILSAHKLENLELKKVESSWLTPKVYKGKSMHEEEMG